MSKTPAPTQGVFGAQWSLFNDGDFGGCCDADINAAEAWQLTQGANVLVGFVDTGLRSNNSIARWQNEKEKNGQANQDDDGDQYIDDKEGWAADSDTYIVPDDGNSHGTAVASVVGAHFVENKGMIGIAPAAGLVPCRYHTGADKSAATVSRCLDYFRHFKQAHPELVAINLSLEDASNQAMLSVANLDVDKALDALASEDLLMIAAAGNTGGGSPTYPASHKLRNLIAVMATDNKDQKIQLSCSGKRTVHLAAPGAMIKTLHVSSNPQTPVPDPAVQVKDGTSYAAPHVTGVAALLASHLMGQEQQGLAPGSPPRWLEIRNRILAGGTPVEALADETITGRRLRAWDSCASDAELCTGALTCRGQHVRRRLEPEGSQMNLTAGTDLEIKAFSIGCRQNETPEAVSFELTAANAPLPATCPATKKGEIQGFRDDGNPPDRFVNDGEWLARWHPPCGKGTYRLCFWDVYGAASGAGACADSLDVIVQ